MYYVKKCFDTSQPSAKLVARYFTAILWAIGSLYIMSMEWGKPNKDWLVILATPLLWLIIIGMPVLAGYAWQSKHYLAAILLSIGSIVGLILNLEGTVSRQSDFRDSNITNVNRDEKLRADLDKRLIENHAMLDEELQLKKKKCDTNPNFDCEQIEASIKVYKDAVEGVKRDLDKLGKLKTPLAGEVRIAKLISWYYAYSKEDAEILVADIKPLLFGIFCEFGAFALAVFGFHRMSFIDVGNGTLEINPFNNKAQRIAFLEQQLQSENINAIDKRVLLFDLEKAKQDLVSYIQKR